jgi:uncharacterized membrane protein YkvA (DUF1232 family)
MANIHPDFIIIITIIITNIIITIVIIIIIKTTITTQHENDSEWMFQKTAGVLTGDHS